MQAKKAPAQARPSSGAGFGLKAVRNHQGPSIARRETPRHRHRIAQRQRKPIGRGPTHRPGRLRRWRQIRADRRRSGGRFWQEGPIRTTLAPATRTPAAARPQASRAQKEVGQNRHRQMRARENGQSQYFVHNPGATPHGCARKVRHCGFRARRNRAAKLRGKGVVMLQVIGQIRGSSAAKPAQRRSLAIRRGPRPSARPPAKHAKGAGHPPREAKRQRACTRTTTGYIAAIQRAPCAERIQPKKRPLGQIKPKRARHLQIGRATPAAHRAGTMSRPGPSTSISAWVSMPFHPAPARSNQKPRCAVRSAELGWRVLPSGRGLHPINFINRKKIAA